MQYEFHVSLYVLLNGFRTYVLYRFMRVLLDQTDKNRYFVWMVYVLFSTVVSFFYLVINIPLLTMAANLGGLLLVSFLYPSSWKSRLFSIVACYTIFVCAGALTVFLFGALNTYSSVPGMIMTNLLPFAVLLLLEKCLNKIGREDIPLTYWVAVFFIPVSSVFLSVIVAKSYWLSSEEIILSILVLLSFNVLVFYLYDTVSSIQVKKREQIVLSQQNEYNKKQYELMSVSLENSRLLRHDLKNHWFILCELLERNESVQAVQYMKNMLQDAYVKGEFAHSGCMEIDCMLNFKLQEAEIKGIHVDLSLEVSADLVVNPSDLAIVLGNLLDNAIEGASKAKEKWIDISIHNKVNLLLLQIKNSYDGILLFNDQTRKTDTENHGMGLRSVRRVLEKNNGELILDWDCEQFTVNVLMYIK